MNKILVADNSQMSIWVYPERGLLHHLMKAYGHEADEEGRAIAG